MGPSSTTHTTLPTSHPLITELISLRQQLGQFQKSAHQTGIQLQGARLELSLVKEENAVLREGNNTLKSEVDVLRANPAPPPTPPTSTALSELSLAHRRLSSKLDLTESALTAAQLELASAKQEIQRLLRERDADRATINDFRRTETDREEEVAWERGERRKAEEMKKLCDLALKEYKGLVKSLDADAVPPETPSRSTTILQNTPDLSSPSTPLLMTPGSTTTAPESISNLLVGQRGVHRLFDDFTSTLADKEKALHAATTRVEELEHTLSTVTDQLAAETAQRIEAQEARDRVLRDDASAAKVVERYMTFTQKTHATVHLHLNNLRARTAATQATLRKEAVVLKTRLQVERERAERLRQALDEASENAMREAVGRRREVGMRLKMISHEEVKERKVEIWLDRVRRAREGVEGAVVEADVLETLLDEGIEAIADQSLVDTPRDKQRSWRGLLRKRAGSVTTAADNSTQANESSIARVLLAEELVDTLVKDLQVETDRRLELEKQRVEWLAKEAVEGREPQEQNDNHGHEVFDLENEEAEERQEVKPEEEDKEIIDTPPPLPPSIATDDLKALFQPLQDRYAPLQKSLHDLSHSLASLRTSLPTPSSPHPSFSRTKKFLPLPLLRTHPTSDPILSNILDNIHEVIEDARVDVEIALADEDRVFRGFEALLGVGSVVQSSEVLKDAKEFVEDKLGEGRGRAGFDRLEKKVEDLEHDLAVLKAKVHEVEDGMEITIPIATAETESEQTNSTLGSIWADLPLRTVTPPQSGVGGIFSSPLLDGSSPSSSAASPIDSRRPGVLSNVSSVGRSFSASVISAPRRVSGLAGGLYRPRRGGKKSEEKREGKDGDRDGGGNGDGNDHDDVNDVE